jgi:mannose-6-phosphate isomerase-like protein (cupin superfamily)
MPTNRGQVFTIGALSQQRAATAKPYLEFLRVPAMSAGLYVLAAGATDQQKPHGEDEIYYVLRGKARMRVAGDEFDVAPGQVIFVPARAEHRFFEITEELGLLVFFAPAESG